MFYLYIDEIQNLYFFIIEIFKWTASCTIYDYYNNY